VLLQGSNVPIIDTLVQQNGGNIGAEDVTCTAWTGSYFFVGTTAGNLWVYQTSVASTWVLITTFDGPIYALYWLPTTNQLFIGGDFNVCIISGTIGYNRICFINNIDTPQTPQFVIWSNTSDIGFNNTVYSITADVGNGWLYFGGRFTYTSSSNIQLTRFASWDYGINNFIYSLNNLSNDGFDDIVWNIRWVQGWICATGQFTNLYSFGLANQSDYCIGFELTGGNNVNQIQQFAGTTSALTSPIGEPSLITDDGSNFYIGTNSVYSGVNFCFGMPASSSFGSFFQVGNNEFSNSIRSLTYYSGVQATDFSNVYYNNGVVTGTLPFVPFVFFFDPAGILFFYSQGVGEFYAFNGSTTNQFVFSGGRFLYVDGVQYTTGFNFANGANGKTATLYWNGLWYSLLTNIGNGTPI
jgi:hypothetical protein